MKSWKRLSTEIRCVNPFWEHRVDQFELPNGKTGTYDYLHTNGAVQIVPLGSDGHIHLIRQYRYLFGRDNVDFPGGGIKSHQTCSEAAAAELAEETGFAAGSLVDCGAFATAIGHSDMLCHIFLATKLTPMHAQADETEEFEQLAVTPDELEALIADGSCFSALTIATWYRVRPIVLAYLEQLAVNR